MEYTDVIRVGRDNDSEVRVTDISVSRLHAFIKRSEDGSFSVLDNNSKFGTLALINEPKCLRPKNTYFYQFGRTLFEINIVEQKKYAFCLTFLVGVAL